MCAMNYIVRWLKQSRAIWLNAFNPSKYSFWMWLANMYYMYVYERMTQEPVWDLCLSFHSWFTPKLAQPYKAWSQKIIKYKLNVMRTEIKHVYPLFELGSLKLRVKCHIGLGPPTCFSSLLGLNEQPQATFKGPQHSEALQTSPITTASLLLQIQKPLLQTKRILLDIWS